MTMTNRSLITGVFQDHAMADQAIETLKSAGFDPEQIMHSGKSAGHAGGFLAGLKSLFTGEDIADEPGNVQNDLMNMGIPEAQASHYEQQYEAGRCVVVVNAKERKQEALSILQNSGAYETADHSTPSASSISGNAMGAGSAMGAGQRDQNLSGTPTDKSMRDRNLSGTPVNTGKRDSDLSANPMDAGSRNRDLSGTPMDTAKRDSDVSSGIPPTGRQDRNLSGTPMDTSTRNQSTSGSPGRQDRNPSRTPGNTSSGNRDRTGQPVDTSMRGRDASMPGTPVDETDAKKSIRLREEQLQATKQRVQTGEVTLHKDVVSEDKSIDVPVTHEEVFIERRDVPAGQIDNSPIGEDETIRVPVSEDQVDVTKNSVVTGEVTVSKRNVQEEKRIKDSVRHEEARVEQRGDAPIHGTDSDYLHPDQRDNKQP